MRNKSGRNSTGQIVVRHHGGRRPWSLLRVDHLRASLALPLLILSFAKRSQAQPLAALAKYPNGALSYITAPQGVTPGSILHTWVSFDHFFDSRRLGNVLALRYIHQGDHLFGMYTREGARLT